MATCYRNAFFGFSGFVTSAVSAKKDIPAKASKGTGRVVPSPKKAGRSDTLQSGARSQAA